MSHRFSPLPDSRVEEAFAVLDLVGRWTQAQGRRQRISSILLDAYRRWQAEQANYIVTEDQQIVGLATLRRERLSDWPEFVELGPVWMLRGLATHPDRRGQGVGAFAVARALEQPDPNELVYLDCISQFLPGYYAQLGFERLARQQLTHADGESFDVTLMRYQRDAAP